MSRLIRRRVAHVARVRGGADRVRPILPTAFRVALSSDRLLAGGRNRLQRCCQGITQRVASLVSRGSNL